VGETRRLLTAATAVALSYAAVRTPATAVLDQRAGARISRPLGPVADRVISAGTDLGSVFAIAGISATLAATGRRGAALDVLGAGALGWTAAQAVKPLLDRPRPYQADGVVRLVSEPAGTSWPSGHVAVAGAMAAAVTPRLGSGGRLGAAALAGFVGLSRIYVGVHYVSDVVAGLGVGLASASTWRALRHRVSRRRRGPRRR
jgi:membrane-associated phospholipid phosphatase